MAVGKVIRLDALSPPLRGTMKKWPSAAIGAGERLLSRGKKLSGHLHVHHAHIPPQQLRETGNTSDKIQSPQSLERSCSDGPDLGG
jgi:hypothetical protein